MTGSRADMETVRTICLPRLPEDWTPTHLAITQDGTRHNDVYYAGL